MVVLFGFHNSVLLVGKLLTDLNLYAKLYQSTAALRLLTGRKMEDNTEETDVSNGSNSSLPDVSQEKDKSNENQMPYVDEKPVIQKERKDQMKQNIQRADDNKHSQGVSAVNSTVTPTSIVVILALFSVLAGGAWRAWPNNSWYHKPYCNLNCEIYKLEKMYCSQSEELWISLTTCLSSTISKNLPCVITLLNGGNDDLSNLLNDIGEASVRLLNSTENFLIHEGSTMVKSNFSFNKCKENLMKHKVMLVPEMDKIPGEVLSQFHAFCDVHDAAVKPAVIIFMLNHKDINVETSSNINTLGHSIMYENWGKSLHHDIIDALSVRLLDYTVKIYPENKKCK